MLQGGPGLTSRSVAPIAERLQDDFRVIRFEHTAWNVRDVLEQMDAMRSDLGEERWCVLGHSWGAALASLYAITYPDRVRALVLAHPLEISTAFCDPGDDALCGGDEQFAEEHDADVAAMLWEDLEATCPDATSEGYDLAPVARQIVAPSLVLLGERDAIDSRSGERWAELTSGQLISMQGAGHWSFLDRPAEFQRVVTEFLMSYGARRTMTAAVA